VTDKPETSFAQLSDLGFVTGAGTLGIVPSGPAGFPQTVPPEYFNNFSIRVNTLTNFNPTTLSFFRQLFEGMGAHTLSSAASSAADQRTQYLRTQWISRLTAARPDRILPTS
jgi:hypothetical protein